MPGESAELPSALSLVPGPRKQRSRSGWDQLGPLGGFLLGNSVCSGHRGSGFEEFECAGSVLGPSASSMAGKAAGDFP